MNIQTRNFGENQVIISSEDLAQLLEFARKVTPIEIEETDFDSRDLMRLAETNGALDFLHDERENIYTANDLKVKYK